MMISDLQERIADLEKENAILSMLCQSEKKSFEQKEIRMKQDLQALLDILDGYEIVVTVDEIVERNKLCRK